VLLRLLLVLGVLALFPVGTAMAAPDRTPPKMKAAVMKDADHDGRADTLVLTFTERVVHRRDADGRYPFTVTGYGLRSVGAASGKTIVLALVEKASPDGTAKPGVTYRRTTSKPVRDRAGNQAPRHTFRGTKATGIVPPDTAILTGPSGTVSGLLTFTYSSNDPAATFECALDDAPFASCPQGQTQVLAGVDGPHSFQIRAVGLAGPDPTPAARAWTTDGDGDGFAAPTDCAPADPAIHPGATDLPEPTFTDTNCDGIDGDKALAIFVKVAARITSGCGAFADPCGSVLAGIAEAVTQGKHQVYLSAGTYPGVVTLANNVDVYGGFSASWARSAATTGDNQSVAITGNLDGATGKYLTVKATSVTAKLTEVKIVGPNAVGAGASSYGVVAQASTLTLDHVIVNAGNGVAGSVGTAGGSASQAAAATGGTGGNGAEVVVSCDASTRGAGGPAGVNGAVGVNADGGMGGGGGTMDSGCPCAPFCICICDARPGDAGAGATLVQPGIYGAGGAGGPFKASGCETGVSGTDGLPGRVSDGNGGAAGNGSQLVSSFWVGNTGAAGTLGLDGGGGGGGGGAAGCDDGIDAYGAGGGGGGAGGAKASAPGGGGGAGGGSFAVFAVSSVVTVTSSTITRGVGGNGGQGGQGGAGQPGGPGGPGGLVHPGSGAAGNGGPGGHGGHSGGGGGGQGGHSFAFYGLNSTFNRTLVTTLGGTAGAGGTAGPASSAGGNAGSAGTSGTLGVLGTCVIAGAC